MQSYCPRCGGEMEKRTYDDHFHDVTLKNTHTWYGKLTAYIIYFLQGDYRAWGPGMLKCMHCGYYDENIPSSFHKEGNVMVPLPQRKVKNVNPILAIVIIGIASLFVVYLLFLSTVYK